MKSHLCQEIGYQDAFTAEHLERRVVFSGHWEQITKLTDPDGAPGDWLGHSVCIDGDIAVVGDPHDDDGGDNAGAAFVYERVNGTWIPRIKLLASDASDGDRFGTSVAVQGSTIVVGATWWSPQWYSVGRGAAYVFERSGDSWTQVSRLTSSDGESDDEFGNAVAVSGDLIVVGVSADDHGQATSGIDAGAAYVFERVAGVWTETATLFSEGSVYFGNFGASVAATANSIIVGAPGQYGGDGEAYVFERAGGSWARTPLFGRNSSATRPRAIGGGVSISGNVTVVTSTRGGHVFERSGNTWTWVATVAQSVSTTAASVSGNRALFGATAVDAYAGAGIVAERTDGVWSMTLALTAADRAPDHGFGMSVSISGDSVIIGSEFDDDHGAQSGSAYMFQWLTPPRPVFASAAPINAGAGIDGSLTLAGTDPQGRSIILSRRGAEGPWMAFQPLTSAGADAARPGAASGGLATYVDARDGLTYAAAATPEGLILLRQDSAGTWTARNLTTEVPGAGVITSALSFMTSFDGFTSLVGLDRSGDLLRYFQTAGGHAGAWTWGCVNIAAEHLRMSGLTMPAFAGPLVSYATRWGGLNVAGLDAHGTVWSVWWAPGMDRWRSTNLSHDTGAPALNGSLTVFQTPWETVHLGGLDASGHVQVTWWAPGFTAWRVNDLTAETRGPVLATLSSYVSSWGGLNVVGLNRNNGAITQYWWAPANTNIGWAVTALEESLPLPARPHSLMGLAVPGHHAPIASLNVFATLENSHVVRLFFMPEHPWQLEDLTELSGEVT